MIRVCHIANIITGKADGVYSHLKMIFRCYDKTKFKHCLIFQGGEKIEKELHEMDIEVFVSSSLNKKLSFKAFADINRVIKENNIDIIQTHLNKSYAIGGLVNIFLRKKFIYNYHGLFLADNPYYNPAEQIIYRTCHLLIYLFGKVNAAIVPSERSKQLLMNETKLFPDPIVYYNGYDCNKNDLQIEVDVRNKIEDFKKHGFIIAVVSRLEIQKRIDRALDLFKQLSIKRNDVNLLIFGDGDLKEELIRGGKSSGIDSKVVFFDYVKDITAYYKYFDIILFTSDWEGMPLVMWEAMGNKIPVVAPDVGGFKEILAENNCGIVYKPGNLNEAEDAILKIIEDKELKNEFGINGYEAVKSKYNSQNFIRQMENIYANL